MPQKKLLLLGIFFIGVYVQYTAKLHHPSSYELGSFVSVESFEKFFCVSFHEIPRIALRKCTCIYIVQYMYMYTYMYVIPVNINFVVQRPRLQYMYMYMYVYKLETVIAGLSGPTMTVFFHV